MRVFFPGGGASSVLRHRRTHRALVGGFCTTQQLTLKKIRGSRKRPTRAFHGGDSYREQFGKNAVADFGFIQRKVGAKLRKLTTRATTIIEDYVKLHL